MIFFSKLKLLVAVSILQVLELFYEVPRFPFSLQLHFDWCYFNCP